MISDSEGDDFEDASEFGVDESEMFGMGSSTCRKTPMSTLTLLPVVATLGQRALSTSGYFLVCGRREKSNLRVFSSKSCFSSWCCFQGGVVWHMCHVTPSQVKGRGGQIQEGRFPRGVSGVVACVCVYVSLQCPRTARTRATPYCTLLPSFQQGGFSVVMVSF